MIETSRRLSITDNGLIPGMRRGQGVMNLVTPLSAPGKMWRAIPTIEKSEGTCFAKSASSGIGGCNQSSSARMSSR